MKKNNVNTNATATPITFTQVKTVVTADRYVPYALYTQNKAIVEQLGGEIVKGVGGFQAKFAKTADAKAFVAQAVTHMSEKAYNAARKTEPKALAKATNGKGVRKNAVEYVTLTDDNGNTFQVPKSALAGISTSAKKGKGNTKPTTAPKAQAQAKAKTEPKATKRVSKKGNGIDFNAIKGADNKAKNKALHAMLVGMGMADSRAKEYQAIWSARPWAK